MRVKTVEIRGRVLIKAIKRLEAYKSSQWTIVRNASIAEEAVIPINVFKHRLDPEQFRKDYVDHFCERMGFSSDTYKYLQARYVEFVGMRCPESVNVNVGKCKYSSLCSVSWGSPYVTGFELPNSDEVALTYRWLYDCLTTVRPIDGWRRKLNHIGQSGSLKKMAAAESCLRDLEVAVEHGTYPFSVARSNGRVSTLISQMPKIGRRCIEFDGSEDLVSIDLTCAQPYLLLPLARELHCYDKDIEAFYEALACDLYSWLSKASSKSMSRQNAKEEVLRALYSHNGQQTVFKDTLALCFPDIERLLYRIKDTFPYNHFALLMQRLESDFMIRLLGTALRRAKIKALTVHDCLIVKSADANVVQDMVRGLGQWYTGFQPFMTVVSLE